MVFTSHFAGAKWKGEGKTENAARLPLHVREISQHTQHKFWDRNSFHKPTNYTKIIDRNILG